MMALSGEIVADVRKGSWIWDIFLQVEATDFNNGFDKGSAEVGFLPLVPTHPKSIFILYLVLYTLP